MVKNKEKKVFEELTLEEQAMELELEKVVFNKQLIERIVLNIQKAPQTFIHIARSGNSEFSVYGPNPPEDGQRISEVYNDKFIRDLEKGEWGKYEGHLHNGHSNLYGAIPPDYLAEGIDALPLLMRFARAKIIEPVGVCEETGINLWSVKNWSMDNQSALDLKSLLVDASLDQKMYGIDSIIVIKNKIKCLLEEKYSEVGTNGSTMKIHTPGSKVYNHIIKNYE